MTPEQKQQIIDLIKQHIDENDSVRIGWCAEQILKSKQQNHILDKLSAAITKTNEYIREPANPNFAYDWNIRKNPVYKKESWSDRNKILFQIIVGLITAIFSLVVGVILWSIDKRQADQKRDQLQDQVKVLSDRLDSLSNSQNKQTDTLSNK
ncbi:MAG: hypothetical protein QM668_21515 [Agriterribacter sp.]